MPLAASRASRMNRFRAWSIGIGIALVLSFSAAAWLQYHQAQLLSGAWAYRLHELSWAAVQMERETLRLRSALQQAIDHPGPGDADALGLRYELFVSRLRVLEELPSAVARGDLALLAPAMRQVRETVAAGEPVLGASRRGVPDEAALRAFAQRVDALGATLHDLTQDTHLYVAAANEDYARRIATQTQVSIGLTVFQSVLVLGFALLALRQVRELQKRHGLEAMAQAQHEARLEAEAASRAKSAFLANMSHELRTPFHGLLGMMALLEETPLTPVQADFLRTAKDSARHLLAILNDILDMSKLESGRLAIAPAPTRLAALFDDVELLMRPLAEDKGLALAIALEPGLPAWVRADGTRVKQILFNLLSNAIKFTERGSVELSATRTIDGELRVAIRDSGVGIDAATLAQLFTRFHQADASTSRRHGGTGLGLEISRSLARLMGGDIEVESAPQRGSTFTLRLPLDVIADAPTGARETPVAPPAPGALAALRVLVCEDHEVNRKYLAALLEKMALAPCFAANGEEALARASERDFDIVLMDVHMPVMDGLAATRAIRALPRGARPRIVALTADAFDESRQRALDAGMDDFLAKPVQPAQLLELLARHAPSAPLDAPPGAWCEGEALRAAVAGGCLDAATLDGLARVMSAARYAEIARLLLDDAHGSLRALDAALSTGDLPTATRQAHGLKGAAANLGLHALAGAAADIEAAARGGDAGVAQSARAGFDAALDATRQALRPLLSADRPAALAA
jgi:signal transduction histidine kinase/HPt (histidine-containing phosphotransfer) domain-containing protein/ActR/RegA family two-component response regulator